MWHLAQKLIIGELTSGKPRQSASLCHPQGCAGTQLWFFKVFTVTELSKRIISKNPRTQCFEPPAFLHTSRKSCLFVSLPAAPFFSNRCQRRQVLVCGDVEQWLAGITGAKAAKLQTVFTSVRPWNQARNWQRRWFRVIYSRLQLFQVILTFALSSHIYTLNPTTGFQAERRANKSGSYWQ